MTTYLDTFYIEAQVDPVLLEHSQCPYFKQWVDDSPSLTEIIAAAKEHMESSHPEINLNAPLPTTEIGYDGTVYHG